MVSNALSHFIDGFRKLRNGALFALIAVMLSIALASFSMSIWISFMWMPHHGIALSLGLSLIIVILTLVFAIIALVLWLAAADSFRRYSEKLAIGRIGLILQLVALILLVIGF